MTKYQYDDDLCTNIAYVKWTKACAFKTHNRVNRQSPLLSWITWNNIEWRKYSLKSCKLKGNYCNIYKWRGAFLMCRTVMRDFYRLATHFCNSYQFIFVLISTVTVHRKKCSLLFSVLVFSTLFYFVRTRLHRVIFIPKIQMLKDPQKSCLFSHCSIYESLFGHKY